MYMCIYTHEQFESWLKDLQKIDLNDVADPLQLLPSGFAAPQDQSMYIHVQSCA
jgi:hypothetical protein